MLGLELGIAEHDREEVDMKRRSSMWIAVALVGAAVAPGVYAQEKGQEPSAVERLLRQEDARRDDPRLGIAQTGPEQPSAVERLLRQEDARSRDPRLGLGVPAASATTTPSVQVVVPDGFDWPAAAIGALAGMAALLLAIGTTILVRSHALERT